MSVAFPGRHLDGSVPPSQGPGSLGPKADAKMKRPKGRGRMRVCSGLIRCKYCTPGSRAFQVSGVFYAGSRLRLKIAVAIVYFPGLSGISEKNAVESS